MKTLYLLRHAKSSWDNLSLRDKDRPLNERGIEAATAMGRYLADNGPLPDMALCSPSVRTRETTDRFLAAANADASAAANAKSDADLPVEIVDALYNGSDRQMLAAIQNVSDDHDCLMVVAHYPAIPALAVALCGRNDNPDQDGLFRLARKYPTGALAEISLPVERWADADVGVGALQRFVRPKSLL